jgi:hypothetical protein
MDTGSPFLTMACHVLGCKVSDSASLSSPTCVGQSAGLDGCDVNGGRLGAATVMAREREREREREAHKVQSRESHYMQVHVQLVHPGLASGGSSSAGVQQHAVLPCSKGDHAPETQRSGTLPRSPSPLCCQALCEGVHHNGGRTWDRQLGDFRPAVGWQLEQRASHLAPLAPPPPPAPPP